jgi:hypothetical protein
MNPAAILGLVTGNWQCLPPRSGRRVSIPSLAPALMAKSKEQGGVA